MKKLNFNSSLFFGLALSLIGITSCTGLSTTANSFYNTGKELENKKRYSEAFEFYQKAANAGHAQAMNALGSLYEKGKGWAWIIKGRWNGTRKQRALEALMLWII